MTFLRGKSTSYSRFPLPQISVSRLDEIVHAYEFRDIPPDELQAVGFCSYRNLLDASIDRGFVNATKLWLTGLRKDTKKAPSALVRAMVARELAELRQTYPMGIPKSEEKQIRSEVKRKLDLKAQARPAHAAVLVNVETGLAYVDGIASAHDWVHSALCQVADSAGFEQIYGDTKLNSHYLAWCAWRASHGVDTPVSPSGDITFQEPKDSSAAFDGHTDIGELLDYWIGAQQAQISSVGLTWGIPEWGANADVTLQSGCLKVSALEFPDVVLDATGTLDDRLEARLSFIMAFEAELAKDFMAFGQAIVDEKIPEEFAELVQL